MSGTRHRVRVQHHGQITLPAALRRKLGLKPGDLVDIDERGAGVLTVERAAERRSVTSARPVRSELSTEQLAERHAAIAEIRALRKEIGSIAPLTAVDLVRMGREELGRSHDPGAELSGGRRL
ncbi:MAG TPA: AbrB/MazE/SpoVT family DNA-binding domain-containing protein [Dehalococcoidia bacterium]|nr:AbrB/MazE/SpoVT family DNA-binding domain-containing protein [Dehalococcoidia bacterium]